MKVIAVLFVVACLAHAYTVNADASAEVQAGTCGGDCTSSARCASEAGDVNCRCSYLKCKTVPGCGGGCVFDSQCADWAGGDERCVCTWWFECHPESLAKNPGYLPFLKMAAMAKANKSFKEVQEANRLKEQAQE